MLHDRITSRFFSLCINFFLIILLFIFINQRVPIIIQLISGWLNHCKWIKMEAKCKTHTHTQTERRRRRRWAKSDWIFNEMRGFERQWKSFSIVTLQFIKHNKKVSKRSRLPALRKRYETVSEKVSKLLFYIVNTESCYSSGTVQLANF